eukprot:13565619-Heterocapsa_arctica.AAC.1
MGRGSDGLPRWGSDGGARVRDGCMVPVPEEEASLVLAGSYLGVLMVDALAEPEAAPSGPAAAAAAPTTATTTASSMVDLKGLVRPE